MNYVFSNIPEYMQHSIKLYVEEGLYPGDFLMFIFINDFLSAAKKADDLNQRCLYDYAKLLYNLPFGCSGNEKKVQKWMNHGGLKGLEEQHERKKT